MTDFSQPERIALNHLTKNLSILFYNQINPTALLKEGKRGKEKKKGMQPIQQVKNSTNKLK